MVVTPDQNNLCISWFYWRCRFELEWKWRFTGIIEKRLKAPLSFCSTEAISHHFRIPTNARNVTLPFWSLGTVFHTFNSKHQRKYENQRRFHYFSHWPLVHFLTMTNKINDTLQAHISSFITIKNKTKGFLFCLIFVAIYMREIIISSCRVTKWKCLNLQKPGLTKSIWLLFTLTMQGQSIKIKLLLNWFNNIIP